MADKINYIMVYVPDRQLKLRDKLKIMLTGTSMKKGNEERDHGIDANYSRIFASLLPSIYECTKQIIAAGKNYRHYNWKVTIEEKGKNNEEA